MSIISKNFIVFQNYIYLLSDNMTKFENLIENKNLEENVCTNEHPCSDPCCHNEYHKNHKLIWPSELKKTKQRLALMDLLKSKHYPMSASEIFIELSKQEDKVSLSTIYRNLESMRQYKLLRTLTMPQDETVYYELNRDGHTHYAICLSCQKIIKLNQCPLEQNCPELDDLGFKLSGHKIELYGYCKECREKL